MSQQQNKVSLIDVKYTMSFAITFLAIAFAGFFLLAASLLFLLNRKLGISYFNDLSTLSQLQEKLPAIVFISGVIQAVLSCLVLFLLSLLWAHAVAGPLIRVRRCLEMLRQGQWMENINFRRDDQLHELARAIKNFQTSSQQRQREFNSYVKQAERLTTECEILAASQETEAKLDEQLNVLKKVYLDLQQMLNKEKRT